MTYSDIIEAGGGTWDFFIAIAGCKYVLATTSDEPDDSWYTSGNYVGVLPGIRLGTLQLSCQARPGEVWPDARGMSLEFDDHEGTLGAYLKSIEGSITTELTATLSDSATTAYVVDTTYFQSSGVLYIDQEAIAYTGKTATTFTGLTRGYYGSKASEHVVDEFNVPACMPEVSDGPGELRGRRVVIYAASREYDGSLSATEQVWIGYVDGYLDMKARWARIPIGHPVTAFSQGVVFGWVPTGRMRGLYIPNVPGARWGRLTVTHDSSDTSGDPINVDVVTDGTAEFFESWDVLKQEILTQVNSQLTDWEVLTLADGRLAILYSGTVTYGVRLEIYGTLAELMGFFPTGGPNIGVAPGIRRGAVEWPANFFAPMGVATTAYEKRIYLRTGEAAFFSTGHIRFEGIEEEASQAFRVLEVDDISDYLVFTGDAGWLSGSSLGSYVMIRGAAPAPTVRQVWVFWGGVLLHQAIRMLYSGQEYSGQVIFDFTAPARWLAHPSLDDDDVDWDELERLCNRSPAVIRRFLRGIEEPSEVSELLTGCLLAAGIYAYVKNDGTIGWAQARVPSQAEARGAVTPSLIDADRAPETETMIGRERLMNTTKFTYTPYLEGGPVEERQLYVIDQRSVQRYGTQFARDVRDPLARLSKRATEIELVTDISTVMTAVADRMVALHMANTVMGLLSKPRAVVHLPVTPQARQLEIGDIVTLTTIWVWDTGGGVAGVSNKLGMIVGYERPLGFSGTDYLDIMLFDDVYGVIAPAALATAWDGPSKTLTFADTDLYHLDGDDSDLQYFEAGDEVRIRPHDSTSGSAVGDVVIAVDTTAKTMQLFSLSSVTVPAIVTFADYNLCSSSQTSEGWVWTADDGDGQIQDEIEGSRWS